MNRGECDETLENFWRGPRQTFEVLADRNGPRHHDHCLRPFPTGAAVAFAIVAVIVGAVGFVIGALIF